ncbi:tetratricopeptide repeat-containing sensor histidine kinase [Nonlabens ulvanivorans]|uniref:tetratricopeptide repeat-containing sensor histidine kinase n=6 Tax=Nonlabens ulvanivorans TaxID=906888 RepID=UPI0032664E5A
METRFFLYISLILCFTQIGNSQSTQLESLAKLNAASNFVESKELIKTMDTLAFSNTEKARYYYENAIIESNTSTDLMHSYKLLLSAKRNVPEDSLELRFKINDELIYTYLSTIENALPFEDLVRENCDIAHLSQDPKMLVNCDFYYIYNEDYETEASIERSIGRLHHSKYIAKENDLIDMVKSIELNLGILYDLANRKDSALYYFNSLIPYYEQQEDFETLKDLYNSKAQTLKQSKRYEEAIYYYNKSLNDHYPIDNQEKMVMVTRNLAEAYYLNKNYEESATLYRDKIRISDSLKTVAAARSLEELEAKYQTTQKEKENLELKADKEKQRNQIYALSGAAIILLLSGGLIYNNQRKKKLIAQKEQIIQKSRADTILKNQELATIDAMITGQQKERKRLAEELHDDLGSTLTTVRLYFENLKEQFSEEKSELVFNRTENLLDEAYEKIRLMSHTRNSGVMASKGLIPTLESLAHKVSQGGKVHVEVLHHGLDQSLENSLELTIFRILQELLSNIIKHAQATNAVISLTAYEDSINIMVEDDGIGFKKESNQENAGIGLHNIEKRIEDLDGTIEIDSQLNHGTTVNLDIPLK